MIAIYESIQKLRSHGGKIRKNFEKSQKNPWKNKKSPSGNRFTLAICQFSNDVKKVIPAVDKANLINA